MVGLPADHVVNLTAALAEALLATRSDAIVAADREGVIRFWNPGAERVFGYTPDEALGRSLDLIIPERLRGRHWEGYERVMQTGQSRYGEADVLAVPALRKDGGTISVEFTIVPLRDQAGGLIALAALLRDVTKRFEETRELKRKLAEVAKRAT
jgi:PAS domain S-box-containing protein